MQRGTVEKIARGALFAALIFLGTFIIKIPLPAAGYVHFGDGFIYVGAVLMGPAAAAAAAAVGGFLSDILAGYAVYAPWTAVIKAAMALPVCWLGRNNRFVARMRGHNERITWRDVGNLTAALVLAGLINVGGYYIADRVLFGAAAAAAVVLMNALQSLAGIAVFFLSIPILARAFKN